LRLQILLIEDGIIVLVKYFVIGVLFMFLRVRVPAFSLDLLNYLYIDKSQFCGCGRTQESLYFFFNAQLIHFWIGIGTTGLFFLLAIGPVVDGGLDFRPYRVPVDVLACPEGIDVDGFGKTAPNAVQICSFELFQSVIALVPEERCLYGHGLAVRCDSHHISTCSLPAKVGNAKPAIFI
jgi:hypothetical protein